MRNVDSRIPISQKSCSKEAASFIYCYFRPLELAAAAKSLQSCPTLCDPIDDSPPCSPIPGILQARTLEWVTISFSNAWKWKVKVKSLSCVQLLATPWTADYQAPSSMGFSRQEHWSGVPLPSLLELAITRLWALRMVHMQVCSAVSDSLWPRGQ